QLTLFGKEVAITANDDVSVFIFYSIFSSCYCYYVCPYPVWFPVLYIQALPFPLTFSLLSEACGICDG
ncbi:hypothetical protein PDN92_30175, partial [Escherichia coli]|uniref:hypothetical protein n=1 Tax=Escherichia coli TaxID=562 RepID=UPI0022F29518